MKHPSPARGALAAIVLASAAACSSGTDAPATTGSCTNNQLGILFTPMHTAYDGVHPFKIPAVVDNIDPSLVKWSASDPSMVDLVSDTSLGGVMISARRAGTVTIIATAGTQCGTSPLTITAATAQDWEVGNMRYNNGVVLTGPLTGPRDAAPMNNLACTNCHGIAATAGPFRTVSHTPQQTGGFSDADLEMILTKGMVPVGGYFDSTVVSYNQWRGFHTWQMTAQELKGTIVYLRSLTPEPQAGRRGDFGRRPDGGMGMGGNPPPPPSGDGGATSD